jgi:hypothetical protein
MLAAKVISHLKEDLDYTDAVVVPLLTAEEDVRDIFRNGWALQVYRTTSPPSLWIATDQAHGRGFFWARR